MRTGVKVLAGDGQVVVSSTRVARMVRYLVARQAEIGKMEKGHLIFNFAGQRGLSVELTEKEDLRDLGAI